MKLNFKHFQLPVAPRSCRRARAGPQQGGHRWGWRYLGKIAGVRVPVPRLVHHPDHGRGRQQGPRQHLRRRGRQRRRRAGRAAAAAVRELHSR